MNTSKALIIASFALLAFTVPMQNANAFTLFGFDLGEIWNNFWNEEEYEKETRDNASEKKTVQNSKTIPDTSTHKKVMQQIEQRKKNPQQVNARTFQRNVSIYDRVYTEGFFKSLFADNQQIRSYVQGFGYKCLAISTDDGTEFTLYFRDNGGLEKMRVKLDCEHQIYLEESLIQDLRDDGGFRAGNIRKYLEKVDVPTGMYLKAIKVFAIG